MKLIFFYISLLSFSIEAQTSIEQEFISTIFAKEKNQNIVYTDRIPKNEFETIIRKLKKNIILKIRRNDIEPDTKLKLTEQEITYISNEFECANNHNWSAQKLPQYKFLSSDTIAKFPDKYSHLYFYNFTKPVFLRENTIVVFYYQSNDWGALRVYIKENNRWDKFYTLYTWVG